MRKLILVLAVLLGVQSAPLAREGTLAELEAAFIRNNSTFVLYHELAHLLIGEFNIPILGREENAADNIATLLLLNARTKEADNALIDSAYGWFLTDAANPPETLDDSYFYDEHNLDLQRAYQIVCLMVGKKPRVFGAVADEAGLDSDRRESCALDYEKAATSWNAMRPPRTGGDVSSDKISIVYEPSEDYAEAAHFLEGFGFFESAKSILATFDLPRAAGLRGKECGEANAYYDSEINEIEFCYESVDEFRVLFSEAEMAKKRGRVVKLSSTSARRAPAASTSNRVCRAGQPKPCGQN